MPDSTFNVSNPDTWNPQANNGIGGTWQSSTGQQISDLGGYLGMREQQQSGSDFGNEQNMLQGLLTDPSKIQETAAYKFRKGQGEQAINRSAAARSMLGSGNVLAELAKYGQNMASQEYDTQANRLADLIRSKQSFGLSSGYYTPETYSPTMGFGKR